MEQLEAVDEKVLVLTERNGGAPGFPALRLDTTVELRAQESQDDEFFRCSHSYTDKSIYVQLRKARGD
jgi:hypothetical protein